MIRFGLVGCRLPFGVIKETKRIYLRPDTISSRSLARTSEVESSDPKAPILWEGTASTKNIEPIANERCPYMNYIDIHTHSRIKRHEGRAFETVGSKAVHARLAAFFEGYHDISASNVSRHPNSNNHALPPRVPHRHLALLRFIYASAERQIHLTSWDVAIRIQVRGIGTHNNMLNIALRSFGRQLHIASVRIGA
ncbi:hypothetical protein SCHPADRAFT_694609 [Schizopora paradoxa]|uniref:Uncharacterized protein n=1 Tax=Schizopora paradoxa TaxID=27342 RepID=A0A0H2R9T0_9AGAM|nr:hypothetical protein SCHPADRAFT_694609 [Schizopora paradoxa]